VVWARTPSGGTARGLTVTDVRARARRDDPGVYVAEHGEKVRLRGEPGKRFTFMRYDRDTGGEFAVLLGGLPGHRIERCVLVDRVQPYRRRKARVVRSIAREDRKDDDGND
jgi:hypothetical protein